MWRVFLCINTKIVTQEKENEIHVSANIRNRPGAAMETVQAETDGMHAACAIKEGVLSRQWEELTPGEPDGWRLGAQAWIEHASDNWQIIAACAAGSPVRRDGSGSRLKQNRLNR